MANSDNKRTVGIYISPKEICIAQVKVSGDGKLVPEHLVKFPTNFAVKEGMQRPLSLNGEFFNEKASWVAPFHQAMKQVNWDASAAVVSLSSQFGILRYFVMPLVDRKFWSKSIPLESKKYIPVSFDEVVYDFEAVPTDGGKKLGVLFGLTQRKSIEFIINTLKSIGLGLASVEIAPVSLERLFGFLDAKDHATKGYIHFSGDGTHMLFSNAGYPVLYRETEGDTGSMSERKRLDIKGAVQFVDRYLGAGKGYKTICLSGEGADGMQAMAAKEAEPITVAIWDPAAACSTKDSTINALLAMGAALRNKIPLKLRLDISGIGAAARMEKDVLSYIWNVTFILGGLLLLLSVISQIRLMSLNSKLSALQTQVDSVPELVGVGADAIHSKIDIMRNNSQGLSLLFASSDVVAPKLSVIVDRIPDQLWLTSINYTNPIALSSRQENARTLVLKGETFLTKEYRTNVVEAFSKTLKSAPEFKPFPFIVPNIEPEGLKTDRGMAVVQVGPPSTVFTITCGSKN